MTAPVGEESTSLDQEPFDDTINNQCNVPVLVRFFPSKMTEQDDDKRQMASFTKSRWCEEAADLADNCMPTSEKEVQHRRSEADKIWVIDCGVDTVIQ